MTDQVKNAFNEQINFEMTSAYLYLAMSINMHSKNYKGYANWLLKQHSEELEHAADFIDFMQKRDIDVVLKDIEMINVDYEKPLEVAYAVLEHERKVTERIYALHDTAKKAGDYASEIFLHSYISEQIQEEDSAQDIIDKFLFAGESKSAQYSVDRELAAR